MSAETGWSGPVRRGLTWLRGFGNSQYSNSWDPLEVSIAVKQAELTLISMYLFSPRETGPRGNSRGGKETGIRRQRRQRNSGELKGETKSRSMKTKKRVLEREINWGKASGSGSLFA